MNKTILNLTQHAATIEQEIAGVVNNPELGLLTQLLTFEGLPSKDDIKARAEALAVMAGGCTHALIGGAPYLMGPLEEALKKAGVQPLYAFSVRESIEKTLPDGKVVKTAVFRHLGFVEA